MVEIAARELGYPWNNPGRYLIGHLISDYGQLLTGAVITARSRSGYIRKVVIAFHLWDFRAQSWALNQRYVCKIA